MKQKAIDEGAEINDVDLSGFIAIAQPQQDEFAAAKGMTDVLQQIRDLAK